MTMDIETARMIERPPIKVGEQYTFYSTVQQEYEPPEKRLRNYTGKLVVVIGIEHDVGSPDWNPDESERMFKVRATNGFEFVTYESELNGWMVDTGQFFWPDATYGPDHDTQFLANERQSNDYQV